MGSKVCKRGGRRGGGYGYMSCKEDGRTGRREVLGGEGELEA